MGYMGFKTMLSSLGVAETKPTKPFEAAKNVRAAQKRRGKGGRCASSDIGFRAGGRQKLEKALGGVDHR